MDKMYFRDVAVVEFRDGFTIAVNAKRWSRELAEEAIRLRRWGDVRVHLFTRDKQGQPVKFETLHARV